MCLAQAEMTRCEKRWNERGPGCKFHDVKALESRLPAQESTPSFVYLRVSANRKHVSPPAILETRVLR
jgi:hypothetical protein